MKLVKRLTNSEEIPNFAAETKQVKRASSPQLSSSASFLRLNVLSSLN